MGAEIPESMDLGHKLNKQANKQTNKKSTSLPLKLSYFRLSTHDVQQSTERGSSCAIFTILALFQSTACRFD